METNLKIFCLALTLSSLRAASIEEVQRNGTEKLLVLLGNRIVYEKNGNKI
jgi:hypothetical protein